MRFSYYTFAKSREMTQCSIIHQLFVFFPILYLKSVHLWKKIKEHNVINLGENYRRVKQRQEL